MTAGIRRNRRRRVQRVWLLVAVLSLFGMLSPFLFEGTVEFLDFNRAGGAVMVFGLLFSITGFVTAGFYASLARTEDKVRQAAASDSPVLHRWTYATDEWSAFLQEAWKLDRARSLGTWKLIAVVSAAVAPILALVTGDIAFTLAFLAGLLAFLSLFAFGAPLVRRRRLSRSPPEVLLSREGLLVGNTLHPFDSAGTTLREVDFRDGWLKVAYSAPTRTGVQTYEADVWVPERLRAGVSEALRSTFRSPES